MKKNTKIALILGGLCAVALIVALVIFIPKNNTPDNPPDNVQDTTQNVENNTGDATNNDELSSNVPIINPTRTDGNTKVPMILNGTKVGEINLIVKDAKFNFPIDELESLNVAKFEKQDNLYIYENETSTFKVGPENIVIITKPSDKNSDGANADGTNADADKKESVENTFEAKGYITIDGKDYLTEDAFVCLFYGYVNNKAASIGDVEARKNTWDIEDFLRDESKVEASKEDLTSLADKIADLQNAFIVNSTSTVKENITSSEIKDLLSFSLLGEGNVISSFKKDNKILVIYDNNVASAIMNSVLGSISEHDLYTNIRVLVTLDEEGKINALQADTYYLFDSRDIYYYITMMN